MFGYCIVEYCSYKGLTPLINGFKPCDLHS